jgi:hypothetical protein
VPKTCAIWADALRTRSARTVPGGQVWGGPACNDLRLVGLKLMFLVVPRAVAVLGLSRREAWWKDAEILMLRHQLAVALRERPRAHSRLTWPDRAWLALLAGSLPAGRPHPSALGSNVRVLRRDRLGGLIHEYAQVA